MRTVKMILAAIYVLLFGWVASDIMLAIGSYFQILIKIICCAVSVLIFIWGVVTD